MSEKELYDLLSTLNLDVAYHHFTKKVQPPFILYMNTDSTSMFADDKTYHLENEYIVDLVTSIKNPTLEQQIQTLFDDNYIPYTKYENYIDQEQIYQIRYFI